MVNKVKSDKELTPQDLISLKEADEGYVAAQNDAVSFLKARRQAVFKIARSYHLDPEELFQEAYEILLTCLRDFTPVYEKANGETVSVMFITFFGNRMESRAMEMRNRNPEYQARQAFADGLSSEEKERFKNDPPLLVQHLDHESPMQESLSKEVSAAKGASNVGLAFKIVQDSFFDRVIGKLISKEKDEKKKAALLHIKVGGVCNFQDIAYHFGVTDSRASQVLNELMDAFFIQRMLVGDLKSVQRDLKIMKFNPKRIQRLVVEAFKHIDASRKDELTSVFDVDCADLPESLVQQSGVDTAEPALAVKTDDLDKKKALAPSYKDVFTEDENAEYPLQMVEVRQIEKLTFTDDMNFRSPQADDDFQRYIQTHVFDDGLSPIVVSENGLVIDGNRRLRLAQKEGRQEIMCIVREVKDDVDCRILRVALNLRLMKPSKTDLYYAISALSNLGLSQQKIASHVGTSRTNVLVYVKIKDKASPQVKALFEDELIQVTNASSCVELPFSVQDKMAIFIRKYGKKWSKGSHFNELYEAALRGDIDTFIQNVSGEIISDNNVVVKGGAINPTVEEVRVDTHIAEALKKRVQELEQQLQDAEVWTTRRESVITQQTEALTKTQDELETLKKELEAAELMKFASPDLIESEMKSLKQFYAVCERMAGLSHGFDQVSKDVNRLVFSRKQKLEVQQLFENIEQKVNRLRISIINNTGK